MSGSASFQSVRKSWYALFALAVSRWKQLSGFNTIYETGSRPVIDQAEARRDRRSLAMGQIPGSTVRTGSTFITVAATIS
jgi:hypothetical protein